MCEDEGTRGGVGTAEAARCGNGGKGTGGLCQWFRWGKVDNKGGEDYESSPQPGRRLRGGKVTGRRGQDVRRRDVSRLDERRREGKKQEGRQLERRRRK